MKQHNSLTRVAHLRVALERYAFPLAVLTLVSASAARISPSTSIVLRLLVIGVVLLGLPHGALDPFIAKRLWSQNPYFTQLRFWVTYAAIAMICAMLWLMAANAALILFLLVSAYHFGSDWQNRGPRWGRFAYGASIVTLPALRYPDTVGEIYRALGATLASSIVITSQVIAIVAIVIASASLLRQTSSRRHDVRELAFIFFGGLFIRPLLFFICYFCLLHSPRHLLETAQRLNLYGMLPIVRAVLPALVATLALAAVLWYFLPPNLPANKTLQIVFIGLAAITVPHMLLSEADKRVMS